MTFPSLALPFRCHCRRCEQNPHDGPQDSSQQESAYLQGFREAERAGFEPAMEISPHTRLAGECLQPLGHLSAERPV